MLGLKAQQINHRMSRWNRPTIHCRRSHGATWKRGGGKWFQRFMLGRKSITPIEQCLLWLIYCTNLLERWQTAAVTESRNLTVRQCECSTLAASGCVRGDTSATQTMKQITQSSALSAITNYCLQISPKTTKQDVVEVQLTKKTKNKA